MRLKCRKICPTGNIKISFNLEDLTESSDASTKVNSLSRSDHKTQTKMKSQLHDLQQLKDQNRNNIVLDKNKYPPTKEWGLHIPQRKLSKTTKEDDDTNSKTLNPRTQHLPQSVISACQTACDINYNSLKRTVKKPTTKQTSYEKEGDT